MNRRRFAAAVTAGAVSASAGCLSDLIDDVTTFEASPIRVSETAADEAGYEYQGTEERVEEREVAGESIEATNYISRYTRTIDLPIDALGGETEAGVFGVVSTPQVHVAGEDFNPVGDMNEAELAEHVQDQYDELEIDRNVGGRAIEPDELSSTVSFETYEGTATLEGETGVDVYVDIAQPDHDDDHLVVIGVYPDDEAVPLEDERERIDTLVAGLEHGDDVDVDIVEGSADDGDGDGDDDDDGDDTNADDE
ncbi:DUF6517 family protein [Natronorubrum halalkaliphilum]|uniref:DUF6517 family protein n=1 Tax=Natronorubrum halalkaliphilum TaxID=2691917 RepID=UPI001356A16E|nr:DUF6517 family protein [Natronorubrum halalkaliphilum]